MARKPTGIISVLIAGDADPLKKEADRAAGILDGLGQKFTSGLRTVATAAGVALGAAGVAFGAFAKSGIDAAIETEAAQARLATLLRNTGLASEAQIVELNRQAEALEGVGVAAASNITVLQGQLATFDLSADAIKTLTPAIVDYVIAEKGAAATADDFQSAANGLAQALQGNFGALSRVGFVLDDTTKDMIANGTEAERAAALVDVLSSTYGGFNEKATETAEGGLQVLRNRFGDLQETIGKALLPVFLELVEGAQRLVGRLKELWEEHGPKVIDAFNKLRDRAVEVYDWLKEKLPEGIDFLRDKWGDTTEAIGDVIEKFAEFIGAVRLELTSTGAFEGIKTKLSDIMGSLNDVKDSFTELMQVLSGTDTEGSVKKFSEFVDKFILDPIESVLAAVDLLIRGFDLLLRGITQYVETAQRFGFMDGVGPTTPSAGGFELPSVPQGGTFSVPQGSRAPQGNVTVNVTSADPNAVVDAIRTYQRRNGPIGIAVR